MDITFRKGDAVTYFGSWDDKGTIRVVEGLRVYSAGKKVMVLVDAAGQKFMGRQFMPRVVQGSVGAPELAGWLSQVRPAQDAASTDAVAMELAEAYLASQRWHYAQCLSRNAENKLYCASIRSSLTALHEPRVIRG